MTALFDLALFILAFMAVFRVISAALKGISIGPTQTLHSMQASVGSLHFRRRRFLSAAETSFFGVVTQAVGSQFLCLAKVRLADLIEPVPWSHRAFNRISSKHVDFVLCELGAVRPVLVIELDDSSHDRDSRKQRDDFVDSALRLAALPVLRVDCKAGYVLETIRRDIQQALGTGDIQSDRTVRYSAV